MDGEGGGAHAATYTQHTSVSCRFLILQGVWSAPRRSVLRISRSERAHIILPTGASAIVDGPRTYVPPPHSVRHAQFSLSTAIMKSEVLPGALPRVPTLRPERAEQTDDPLVADLTAALLKALTREESPEFRADSATMAIEALVRLGDLTSAIRLYAATFPTIFPLPAGSIPPWVSEVATTAQLLSKRLDANCRLAAAIYRAGSKHKVVERLLVDARAIVAWLTRADAIIEDQPSSQDWKLALAYAAVGRLREAVRLVRRSCRKRLEDGGFFTLAACAWRHGFAASADSATARFLTRHPKLRFHAVDARLSVGDLAGARTLARPLNRTWRAVYAERLLDRHAREGDFALALRVRKRCRNGPRSHAELLAGLAAEQGRLDILRQIIAEERADSASSKILDCEPNWLMLRAKAGDETPLLTRIVAENDDAQTTAFALANLAIHLRTTGARLDLLPDLGGRAVRLALGAEAERSFAYYEYGACLAATLAADDQPGTQQILARARSGVALWSNVETCCKMLAGPATAPIAIAFLRAHPRLHSGASGSRCLLPLVFAYAQAGDHRAARRVVDMKRGSGRSSLLAKALLGLAVHRQGLTEQPSHLL